MSVSIPLSAISSSELDEETARADVYGLLARLFYAPADAELLLKLRMAQTEAPAAGGILEDAWTHLVQTARALDDQLLRDEYDTLFGGMGKPEVYLFGSHYLTGFLNEKPLVKLRDDLAELGLGRDEQMPETEDHVAYLFEVMRYLIAGDDASVANLANQRRFFQDHIQPWVSDMCDAISAHPRARFYGAVSEFTRSFTSVESQGFDMLG